MKKIIPFLTFILFFSCQTNDDIKEEIKPIPKEEPIQAAKPISVSIAEKVETDNMFAFELFKTTYTHTDEDNIFISPLSMSMALSMVLNGAETDTKKEMLETLEAQNYSIDAINKYNKQLREALLAVDPTTTIDIANSIWYRNNFTVKKPFIEVNQANYTAEVNPLDFSSPDAVKTINDWCALQTNNKIPEIIKEIPPATVMYLINAIYFKSGWVSKFDKEKTQSKDFHLSKNNAIPVEMMHQTEYFNYTSDNNAQYLELPYGNNAFGMVIMLPKENQSIGNLIQDISNEQWNKIITDLSGKEINVQLPRFKLECSYNMEEVILPKMGMKVPFTIEADFSEISDAPTLISKVTHKTYIEVNEEGTEAAAITNISEDLGSSGEGPVEPQIIDYFVNKPFAFAIYEKSTGIILFMGKVGNVE